MKRKKLAKKVRHKKRNAEKKSPPQRKKTRATSGLRQLDASVTAMLTWSQKAEGLGAAIRRSYRSIESETNNINATTFVKVLQKDRPILEELFVWAHEASQHIANSTSHEVSPTIEEGAALVDSLFSRLTEYFDIDVIHKPGTTMATPDRHSKRYKFSERFNPDLPTSRVLFPGLKQGSKIIAPCEVEQIVTGEAIVKATT